MIGYENEILFDALLANPGGLILSLTSVVWPLFNTYVHWLHTGKLGTGGIQLQTPHTFERVEDVEWIMLANLYALSATLRDNMFRDTVANAFLYKIKERGIIPRPVRVNLPSSDCINTIYSRCGPNDPLRKLLVQAYSTNQDEHSLLSIAIVACRPFLQDLVTELVVACTRPARSLDDVDFCNFHSHPESEDGVCALDSYMALRNFV